MSKTILVTGSSSGIGAAIIEYFADRGYNTIITYKQGKDKAFKLRDKLDSRGKHIAVELDVTSEESVRKCAEIISTEYEKLDIVVCNA